MVRRLICVVVFLSGCTVKDPLYCDPEVPCKDAALPFCDLAGEYSASEGIPNTCIAEPEALLCREVGTRCEEGTKYTCNPGDEFETSSSCFLGCDSAAEACARLSPSNDLDQYLAEAEGGEDYYFDGPVIQWGSSFIHQVPNGPTEAVSAAVFYLDDRDTPIFVVVGKSFSFGDVLLAGHPVVFLAAESIEVRGRIISLIEQVDTGENCKPQGSGGWGHSAPGGRGRDWLDDRGGSIVGNEKLDPLSGGCWNTTNALQLSAGEGVAISGGIDLRGWDGTYYAPNDNYKGAGAGGGILIEAPVIEFKSGGGALAAGGAGGCAERPALPDWPAVYDAYKDGPPDVVACNDGALGGQGGYHANEAGGSATAGPNHTPGGGGAAGRIRINTLGDFVVPDDVLIMPEPSIGQLQLQ